jgi:hypothetical protein
MFYRIAIYLLLLTSSICNAQENGSNTKTAADTTNDYSTLLTKLEQQASNKNSANFGTLFSTIEFQVKTNNLTDYPEGFIPYIELEHPEKSIKQLINKDEIVVKEDTITLIIEYPLTSEYRLKINSKHGFTRRELIMEISKAYHKLYEEEEATATIKTVPVAQRTTLYNRNQTNGKYGIWGHDIADLILAEVMIYKALSGEIILSLNIES